MEGIETHIAGGYEQLDIRASEIELAPETFNGDIYAQQAVLEDLRKRWPTFQDSDKKRALARYALLFPRTERDSRPQDCLERIIRLPNSEDVLRALRVRANDYDNYRHDPGDNIYPTNGWFGEYLEYAKWNKVPLALHFWAAATVLGMAVRRNYFLDNGLIRTWANQFIILAGAKANGKSIARGNAMGILRRMNAKIQLQDKSPEMTSAKAFMVPIFGGDVTMEFLIKRLAEDSLPYSRHFASRPGEPVDGEGVCGLDVDELSTLFGRGAHGAQKRVPFFTETAFQEYYHKGTKGDGEENIERMAISVLAHPLGSPAQPDGQPVPLPSGGGG